MTIEHLSGGGGKGSFLETGFSTRIFFQWVTADYRGRIVGVAGKSWPGCNILLLELITYLLMKSA
jgi:hypothetical protein